MGPALGSAWARHLEGLLELGFCMFDLFIAMGQASGSGLAWAWVQLRLGWSSEFGGLTHHYIGEPFFIFSHFYGLSVKMSFRTHPPFTLLILHFQKLRGKEEVFFKTSIENEIVFTLQPLYSKVQPMMVHSTLLFFKLGIGFCGLMSMFLSLYFRRKIMCRLALGRGLRSLSPPYCGLPNKHLDDGVEYPP